MASRRSTGNHRARALHSFRSSRGGDNSSTSEADERRVRAGRGRSSRLVSRSRSRSSLSRSRSRSRDTNNGSAKLSKLQASGTPGSGAEAGAGAGAEGDVARRARAPPRRRKKRGGNKTASSNRGSRNRLESEDDQLPLFCLDVPESRVHLVDSPGGLKAAGSILGRSVVMSIDTETQPSFAVGEWHPTSLLQIATRFVRVCVC